MRPGRRQARAPGPPAPRALQPAPATGILPTSTTYPWQRAEDAGEVVEAFHVSGGRPYFRTADEFPQLPLTDNVAGVQLCAHVYIPVGYVGFIKGVICAPYLGSYFHASAENQILNAIDGAWQTPMGWEVFVDGNGVRPAWRWHLRVLPGTLEDARRGNASAATGFLAPNVPVPTSPAYGGAAQLRLPGRAAGKRWSDNRQQRYGWTIADDQVHVIVPEDATALVFAEWTQPGFVVNIGGEGVTEYALGPSFGALVGAMQRNARPEGQESAREGWRG